MASFENLILFVGYSFPLPPIPTWYFSLPNSYLFWSGSLKSFSRVLTKSSAVKGCVYSAEVNSTSHGWAELRLTFLLKPRF